MSWFQSTCISLLREGVLYSLYKWIINYTFLLCSKTKRNDKVFKKEVKYFVRRHKIFHFIFQHSTIPFCFRPVICIHKIQNVLFFLSFSPLQYSPNSFSSLRVSENSIISLRFLIYVILFLIFNKTS